MQQPDRIGDTANILYLFFFFFTYNPSAYAVTVGPLRSQSHICILLYFLNLSSGSLKEESLWYFGFAKWGNLRKYYADFARNDYGFCVRETSLCEKRIMHRDDSN